MNLGDFSKDPRFSPVQLLCRTGGMVPLSWSTMYRSAPAHDLPIIVASQGAYGDLPGQPDTARGHDSEWDYLCQGTCPERATGLGPAFGQAMGL